MKSHLFLFLLISSIFLFSCQENNSNEASNSPNDPHSYSRPGDAVTKHLDLKLKADFTKKVLSGNATYLVEVSAGNKLILDIKGLEIQKVTVDGNAVDYTIGEFDPILGSPLQIPVNTDSKRVTVEYSTTQASSALQWLEPIQTADKTDPFLFTQGQAILTRTWIPCQDSPGIRMTYTAEITCPSHLMAVMSASNPTTIAKTGIYTFEMQQPIPPYLIALAIGKLEFGSIGDQTGVYAEPSMLKKSLYEFGDMQNMLEAAEELYGAYLWDRYDVLVLPPSFPFGGMENPRLTFATPTIIAGDRSLTTLIAHELAHSWSGNLVTNATWDDFWLNEGFTVYFERRIMEKLYGKEYADMLGLIGFQDLKHTIDDLGKTHADTHLHLHLAGRDPDDGMTDIAYEKGANFLKMLELEVGREVFDKFLSEYFRIHKFKTLNTAAFKDYLDANLLIPNELSVNIDEWIDGPGLPANCPPRVSTKFEAVDEVMQAFQAGSLPNATITSNWSPHEWLHFIRHLDNTIPGMELDKLETLYNLAESSNAEIAAAWYQKCIELGHYRHYLPQIEAFLITVGRRKFLTPIYGALKKANNLSAAQEIYKKARKNYHAVSVQTLDALLDFNE